MKSLIDKLRGSCQKGFINIVLVPLLFLVLAILTPKKDGSWRMCIPNTSLRDFLVWELHDGCLAGHLGMDKTTTLIGDLFFVLLMQGCVLYLSGETSLWKLGSKKS